MQATVPVLYRPGASFVHRRDPRVKMVLFFLLFVFLFIAPSWQWMLVPAAFGALFALNARTPWQWLLVFWAIHIPSFLTIIGVPLYEAGGFTMNDDVGAALKLVLAWTTAILVSVSLASTMEPDDFSAGLRGLGLPAVAAQAVGLSYRLLYVTLYEVFRIADAMKIKGLELETRNPIKLVRNGSKLSLPILFTVLRRAPMLICTLEMRGTGAPPRALRFKPGDVLVLSAAVAVVALATWDRASDRDLLEVARSWLAAGLFV